MANLLKEKIYMKLFQGDPIKPHVDKLMEGITPRIEDVYDHNDIAHISGIDYPSHRYRALINAWRKRLRRELNIDIASVPNVGYRVLNDNERVSAGVKDFAASVRDMGRSVDRMQRADTSKLDEMHRKQQDHAIRLKQVLDHGRKEARQIGFAGRVVTLPRKESA